MKRKQRKRRQERRDRERVKRNERVFSWNKTVFRKVVSEISVFHFFVQLSKYFLLSGRFLAFWMNMIIIEKLIISQEGSSKSNGEEYGIFLIKLPLGTLLVD